MLFWEQSITITSVLMAIGVLVEALLPSGGGEVGKPPPKDETGAKNDYKQTKSISEFTRDLRHESNGSIAWHHWSGFLIKLQMKLVGYRKIYGLWL